MFCPTNLLLPISKLVHSVVGIFQRLSGFPAFDIREPDLYKLICSFVTPLFSIIFFISNTFMILMIACKCSLILWKRSFLKIRAIARRTILTSTKELRDNSALIRRNRDGTSRIKLFRLKFPNSIFKFLNQLERKHAYQSLNSWKYCILFFPIRNCFGLREFEESI